jgi:hypothetical protein
MKAFIPRGYRRLTDVRKEIGHDDLRQQLATGVRTAYAFDPENAEVAIKPIPTRQWLIRGADKIIRSGKGKPYPFAVRDILILVDDVKPKAPLRLVNKGGRPAAADWEAVEEAIRIKIKECGFPEQGNRGWGIQADVERFATDVLDARSDNVGETAIRTHVREILQKLRSET